MGVLACRRWAAGDGSFAGQPRTATLLVRSARKKWDGRPRLSVFWAAGTAASLGSRGRQLRWAAEDGYPTGAVAAKIVGWASSPVVAGQPGRQLRWAAEDGYPTGAVGAKKVGWASSPVRAGQPRTAASLGSRGRLPYWCGRSEDRGMGVLACRRWAAGDGSFAGQPRTATLLVRSERRKWDGRPRLSSLGSRGRQLRWAAGDGYPTGAVGAKKVGWASSPVGAGQPGTAASLGSRGRLPY